MQAELNQTSKYSRPTLASLLWVVGGFLSLVTRMSNFALSNYQSFTIDKSMVKKIFSVEEMPKDYNCVPSEKQENLASESTGIDTKISDVQDTIQSRKIFRASCKSRFCTKQKKLWCRDICCCCKNINKNRKFYKRG